MDCGDGICDESVGESLISCRWDCFAGPVVCGDGFCDILLGETEENCEEDCYQGKLVEAFIVEAESAGIPRSTLEIFPTSVIVTILDDSPQGFLLGAPDISNDAIENTTLGFLTNDDASLQLNGVFVAEGEDVPAGSMVRAYAPYAVETTMLAESQVGSNGDFSINLLDIHPGVTPILLTFTPPREPYSARRRDKPCFGHHN
jgi:hypothetical protein